MYQFFVATSVMPMHQTCGESTGTRCQQYRIEREQIEPEEQPTSRMTTTVVAYTSLLRRPRDALQLVADLAQEQPGALEAAARRVLDVVERRRFDVCPASPATYRSSAGRPGGNRTPNPRFWRPVLCQLRLLAYQLRLVGELAIAG